MTSLEWCPEAADCLKDLTDENNPTDFVVYTVNPKPTASSSSTTSSPRKPPPRVDLVDPSVHKGQGGRQAVETVLRQAAAAAADDTASAPQIMVGAFLYSLLETQGSITTVQRKYVHVVWTARHCSVLTRGKVNTAWRSGLRTSTAFPQR